MLSFIFFLTWVFSRNTSRKQAFSFMLVLLNTKLSVIKPMQLSKACIEYEVELFPVGCLLVVQHDSCRHLSWSVLWCCHCRKGISRRLQLRFLFNHNYFFFCINKKKKSELCIKSEIWNRFLEVLEWFTEARRSYTKRHHLLLLACVSSWRITLSHLISRNANVTNIENHIART